MDSARELFGHWAQQTRCLVDPAYRRAFRSLRNLPRIPYRTVIDGGANRGGFTEVFLRLHAPPRVVLVEAIPEFAANLRARFAGQPEISVVAAAISDTNGEADFEINTSRASSSLLKINPRNSGWFGRKLCVAGTVRVPTLTLPELMRQQNLETVDFLKLDLQGAERLVLAGGEAALARVQVIYTEVLFEPLYAGAWLFWELREWLVARGWKLCGLSNIVHARNGDLLQANATFRQADLHA